ncbi:hypothetical protein [Sporosarcina koreensis]|uniref:5-methylcytosine-specific restriction enzyme subunit McrC n=1 Tax=Sporosarcina koreensis TaxID=334735 RepID=A0ABW0U3I3_9BACL
MKKTDEELLEEVAGYLHGYLKDGTVSLRSFFSNMNMEISNVQDLLKIRFLLLPETMGFVENLPNNIQTIKTTTIVQTATHNGEIRGQIDWPETMKERLRQNYKDPTIFSTSESMRSYNNPENIVLKELLQNLYLLLFEDPTIKAVEQRRWFQKWNGLKNNVAYTYLKNIYIQRIETFPVTDRVLVRTLQHRNPLYREAANLLILFRKMMRGSYDQEDIRHVLSKTMITPENRDVLFELYWLIQLVKVNAKRGQLHLLDGTQNKMASWESGNHVYHLYHDSTGSRNLKFQVEIDELANSAHPYLERIYPAAIEYRNLSRELFNENKSDAYWSGRPDFLLEIYDKESDKLSKVVVGEVKNTSNPSYASIGLRELIDYIHLMKDVSGRYLFGTEVDVSGILCLRDVEFTKTATGGLVTVLGEVGDMSSAITGLSLD